MLLKVLACLPRKRGARATQSLLHLFLFSLLHELHSTHV